MFIWMLYVIAVSVLLGCAAWAAERGARVKKATTRWYWLEPELEKRAPASGNRACLVVLLATSLAAQKGTASLPVGSLGIADRQPAMSRQLAESESLQVVH